MSLEIVTSGDLQFELQKIHAAIMAFSEVYLNEEQKEKFYELYQKTLSASQQSTSDEFEEGGEG